MKFKSCILAVLVFLSVQLNAQKIQDQNFQSAYDEISAMLEGRQPLDFERAVFLTENAYRGNPIEYKDFKAVLDVSMEMIGQLVKVNDKQDWRQYVRGTKVTPQRELQAKESYQKALANWAIYTWMTDTVELRLNSQHFSHLPLSYSNEDPFGTTDWRNSQTLNLFESGKGNCYALVTLFKILSERFKSEASIVTAPQHIYIEHRDPNGNTFNVELATRSFPNMGSIQTLTYTTREGLMNDISMRSLDLKQSVGLCLVYLAKGYQYKHNISDDEFLLNCANRALQYDPKNLNALLLKAQVSEQRVMKQQVEVAPYESLLADLYTLGYRQMPDDMRDIILSKIQGRQSAPILADKNPNPYQNIGEQSRYVTLSNGLFDEVHQSQKIVRYGRTIFDTEKSKIVKFLDEDVSSYQVDPVVFALSVDPLTKSYPELTPYQFAGNTPIQAIDLDGLEPVVVNAYRLNMHRLNGYETALKNGNFEEAQKYYNQLNVGLRSQALGTAIGGGIVLGIYGGPWISRLAMAFASNPVLMTEGTALVAGILYEGADDLCPSCKGDELAKVFRGAGVKALDFFGGKISKYAFSLNIDMQAEKGFKGTVSQFHTFMKKNDLLGTVDNINADNPMALFLNEAGDILKSGGTLTVRGNKKNDYFQSIFDGVANGSDKFEVVSKTLDVSKEGMKRTDQSDIQGIVNEIVLRKK